MKKEILYHGSSVIVDKPEYGIGKPYNDYGRGFYCTKHIELAKEWAVGENADGYVNQYEIDISDLKILNLLDKHFNILHWMALLLKNREFNIRSPIAARGKEYIIDHFLINTDEYDMIVGYRADDSYFSFARDFLNNTITLEQLKYAMELGELKEQYVLVSRKAFEIIKYISSEQVDHDVYYLKRKERDDKARKAYFDQQDQDIINGIYLRDIINGVKIDE